MTMKLIGEGHRPASGRSARPASLAAPLLAALLAAGCASTEIGAQWTDPQWPKQSLRGTTVLVVCDAPDTTVRLLCESRFAARLATLGAKPVTPPVSEQTGGASGSQAALPAARAAGARSVFQTTLRQDNSVVSTGPTFSFGIGGFGGSGGGGGVGGGVGVAMPVGGSGGTGLAASSSLVDAAGNGQVIWSARAAAPAAADVSAQIDELANVLVGALEKAALF